MAGNSNWMINPGAMVPQGGWGGGGRARCQKICSFCNCEILLLGQGAARCAVIEKDPRFLPCLNQLKDASGNRQVP
jgi:hypothetical protein